MIKWVKKKKKLFLNVDVALLSRISEYYSNYFPFYVLLNIAICNTR